MDQTKKDPDPTCSVSGSQHWFEPILRYINVKKQLWDTIRGTWWLKGKWWLNGDVVALGGCGGSVDVVAQWLSPLKYEDEYVWSRAMHHSAGPLSSALSHSAGPCSSSMPHSAGLQRWINWSNFGLVLYDFKEQSIKKSFIGDFPYIIPINKILKMWLLHETLKLNISPN
jgi:hypothetical protein